MKKIFENAVWWSGVVMVGLILGISLQFVRAWTEPTTAPPGGNVGAPINTGVIAQTKGVWGDIFKMGSLGIWGVLEALVVKTDYMQNSSLPTATSGYVLTLDDPATGHVSWKPPTGGSSSSSGYKLFTPDTADRTWTAPAGVTKIKVSAIGGGGGCGDFSGGGSGGFASAFLTPEPGATYSVEIGSRGTCNNDYAGAPDAKPGQPTKLLKGGAVVLSAEGGKGAINFSYPLGGPVGCGQGGEAGAGCTPWGDGDDGIPEGIPAPGEGQICGYGRGGVCSIAGMLNSYGTGGNGGSNDASGVGDAKSGAALIEWW